MSTPTLPSPRDVPPGRHSGFVRLQVDSTTRVILQSRRMFPAEPGTHAPGTQPARSPVAHHAPATHPPAVATGSRAHGLQTARFPIASHVPPTRPRAGANPVAPAVVRPTPKRISCRASEYSGGDHRPSKPSMHPASPP